MRNVSNIFHIFLGPLAFLLLFSCTKKGIIPSEELSRIIGEMYLADQYVQENPRYRMQADSTALYEAIFRKYGYNTEMYRNSLAYYLQKGNAYKKINIRARDLLSERKNALDEILNKTSRGSVRWPILDSVRKINLDELCAYPYLRAVKWFSIPDEEAGWKFTDTSEPDIPGNIRWWILNIDVFSDSLNLKYPVLLKRYLLEKEPASGGK